MLLLKDNQNRRGCEAIQDWIFANTNINVYQRSLYQIIAIKTSDIFLTMALFFDQFNVRYHNKDVAVDKHFSTQQRLNMTDLFIYVCLIAYFLRIRVRFLLQKIKLHQYLITDSKQRAK